MFRAIAERIERDIDYPDRTFTLDVYNRILDGAFYDHLPHGFHQEMSDSNEYVPLRDRRPSVRYGLCRLVVENAVALLFSEGHFPTAECEQEADKESLADVIKDLRLNEIMMEAATRGAVGSVALHLRILEQADRSFRAFVEACRTDFLTPEFDPRAPDQLLRLREKYKVKGRALIDQGYAIDPADTEVWFWFARDWDRDAEIWYLPWKLTAADEARDTKPYTVDTTRTVTHGLGFVPWIWVKNLPGELKLINLERHGTNVRYSKIDGCCTFAAAIDAMIEIDYQLSQAGRGLKYSMDPLLMVKEPAAPSDAGFVKSPANGLIVSENGDAKMLEIEGSAFTVVLDYVRALREYALEAAHGNRSDPQKLSTAQSGRAMELMNQALIWLADKLRVAYGEGAMLSLLKMVLAAHAKFPLTVKGEEMAPVAVDTEITLRWPRWYAPTAHDRQEIATTLKTHKEAGHISRETAVSSIADDYDIEDVQAEITRIEADEQREIDLLPEPQGKVSATV